jgi:hypothetical protein
MARSHSNSKKQLPSNKRQRIHENNAKQSPKVGSVCCWMDYESIESIPRSHVSSMNATGTPIRTPIATLTTKEIFFNRLQQEILIPFRYSLSSQIQPLEHDKSVYEAKRRREIIQQRIICGYNAVSKLLFRIANTDRTVSSNQGTGISSTTELGLPQLIVLVNSDKSDETKSRILPSMLQHIPLLSYELNVPLLLLPSSSDQRGSSIRSRSTSQELAALFGGSCRHISVIAFVARKRRYSLAMPSVASCDITNIATTELRTRTDNDDDSAIENHIHASIDSFIDFIRGKVASDEKE